MRTLQPLILRLMKRPIGSTIFSLPLLKLGPGITNIPSPQSQRLKIAPRIG
jgi:hypothetical protein